MAELCLALYSPTTSLTLSLLNMAFIWKYVLTKSTHRNQMVVDGGRGVNSKSAYSVMVSQALPSLELNVNSFEQVNRVWVV